MRRRDATGSDAEPRLAESWQQNADATSTEVTLRQGIEFHSGKPIDAEAVKATYEAITNEALTNSSQVRGLINNYLESIDLIDNRTLRFNHPSWPGDIIFDMFHFAQIHDADDIAAYQSFESFGGASGPFKLDFDQYEPSESYTVVRNENWYGDVLLDEIEVRTIQDEDTRALALEAEEVDFATVSPEQYLRLGAMEHLSQMLGPPGGMWVLGPVQTHLGGGHPANDDARFRLALHKAIDRQRLHVDVYQEIGDITQQMWLPSSAAYDPDFDTDPFDPEGATALLEASGWDGVEIDMFVSTNVPDNAVPEIIQANLKGHRDQRDDRQTRDRGVGRFLPDRHLSRLVPGRHRLLLDGPGDPAQHELPVPLPRERGRLHHWKVQGNRRRLCCSTDARRACRIVQRLERALGSRPVVAPVPHDQ